MMPEQPLELDNFFATIQNPYPVYAYLREHEPVRWNLSSMKNRPWGFPPREKWFKEASPFRNVAVKAPERPGSPYTLEKFLLDAQ